MEEGKRTGRIKESQEYFVEDIVVADLSKSTVMIRPNSSLKTFVKMEA